MSNSSLFHENFKIIKRSKGMNIVKEASYIHRLKLSDLNTGRVYYGRGRGSSIYSIMVLPDGSPLSMQKLSQDREKFYSEIEKIERRKDAQLGRTVIISNPYPLNYEQFKELVIDYCKVNFVALGMIADISFHSPPPNGDPRNYHAHTILTMRDVTPNGFGKKRLDWNKKALVNQWRKDWEERANAMLERYGHRERIDCRSHKDRGIKTKPKTYIGPAAYRLERERQRSKEKVNQVRKINGRRSRRKKGRSR